MNRGKIYLGLRITVSLSLITFLLLKVDLYSLLKYVGQIKPIFLLMAILTTLFAWLINTYKWQLLLVALRLGKISFKTLLSLNFIGLFYNLFLPGQVGGEVIKGIKLSRRPGLSTHQVFISIVADRATGLFALLIMGGIALLSIKKESSFLLLVVLIGFSILALLISGDRLKKIGQPIKNLMPFGKFLSPFLEAIKTYWRNKTCLGLTLFYSFLFQGLVSLNAYWISLGLGIEISFIALIWIMSLVSLLQMLPVSISGIGVREGTLILLLSQYGIASSKALAFSLIIFGITILMGLIGGILNIKKI